MNETKMPGWDNKAYAVVNADNLVINRIAWNGTNPIILDEGQRVVLDDGGEYPIGSTCTSSGATIPSSAE